MKDNNTADIAIGGPTPPMTREASIQASSRNGFRQLVRRINARLQDLRSQERVTLDGENVAIEDVVAVARYHVKAEVLDAKRVTERVDDSVNALMSKLSADALIYGVNTGFGGSADTRTSDLTSLQRALVQHQNSGVLTSFDRGHQDGIPIASSDVCSTALPTSWVRGMMISRVNSLLRGHSAVSWPVIHAIMALVNNDFTPVVPLRGSISASGDLQPLSYVAAVLLGNQDVYVRTGPKMQHRIITAPQALKQLGLKPVVLAGKEGLGLLNGTAASASLASLVLHDTNNLALLSQALTAMAVEALAGTAESFDPFISIARPQRGQEHAADTILSYLQGSKLAHGFVTNDPDHKPLGLCQDRYALRTSPQWIGPLLEDLELANSQLAVELNSTTDNPLVDARNGGTIHHGGNFQASPVTAAMEKARNAIQQMGKLMFAQATEMNNQSMNRGLPPNLCADGPSLSFTCKGLDINMAAYASELGWLSHPVGPHVQSAEMHNQAVNSLALLSGRATCQAVEVLTTMCATYLFMVCQALDLRVLLVRFFAALEPGWTNMTVSFLQDAGIKHDSTQHIHVTQQTGLQEAWNSTVIMDLQDRCDKTAELVTGQLINYFSTASNESLAVEQISLRRMAEYRAALSSHLHDTYASLRSELFTEYQTITPSYLGRVSSKLYMFVRKDLGVPFFRGLVEDPTEAFDNGLPTSPEKLGRDRKTIGGWVSVIFEALRGGALYTSLMDVLD